METVLGVLFIVITAILSCFLCKVNAKYNDLHDRVVELEKKSENV